MKFCFTFLIFFGLGLSSMSAQTTFNDNFDSYTAGAYLAASSSKWTTWTNKPGTTEDAKISDEYAKSGKNSVKIIGTSATGGGPTDLVLPFGAKYTAGQFIYKMSMYIPSGKNAYFNFQATQTVGQTYALDANFNDFGLTISNSSVPVFQTAFPFDKWFDLEFNINLSSNVWRVLIDNECRGAFANTTASIASIDLYPINNSSVFYVDDVAFSHDPTVKSFVLDASITDLGWKSGKLAGISDKPTCSIRNNGTTPITSVEVLIKTSAGNFPVVLTGLNIIKTKKVALDVPSLTLKPGENILSAEITKLNGTATDEELCNNTSTFKLTAANPAPNKAILVEEGTGTWCQWCPRGAVFMDRNSELYKGLFIPIAVHNGSTDPMVVAEYNAFMAFSSFPNAKINRADELDPSDTENPFLEEITKAPSAKLSSGAKYNETTKSLDVSVEVEFLKESTGEFYLTLALTEDGVRGTTTGYNQSNAYAGGASGVMGGFELLANPVPASKMVYDHVARDVVGLTNEGFNAISGTYKVGDKKLLNFNFVLASGWKPDSMHIVPILLNSGEYVNASTATIKEAIAKGFLSGSNETILLSSKVKVFPNPSRNVTNVELALDKPSSVEVQIVHMNGSLISNKNYGVLSGDIQLPINLYNMQSGVYLIKVKTDAGTRIEKLIVE